MSIQNLKNAIQALTYDELKALDSDGFIFDDMVRLERACACASTDTRTAYKVNGWRGIKIAAIKELRDNACIGLAEAKYVIDTCCGEGADDRRYAYYFERNPELQYVSVAEVKSDCIGLVKL